MLDAAPEGRILEVGAGTGYPFATLVAEEGRRIVGTDLARGLLAEGREVMNGVASDARQLPFPDDSFRLVFCIRSSWYFPDLPRCVLEMLRVLAPGGAMFIDMFSAAAPSNAFKMAKDVFVWCLRILKSRISDGRDHGVVLESRPARVGAMTRRLRARGASVDLYDMRGRKWIPLPEASFWTLARFPHVLAVINKTDRHTPPRRSIRP